MAVLQVNIVYTSPHLSAIIKPDGKCYPSPISNSVHRTKTHF